MSQIKYTVEEQEELEKALIEYLSKPIEAPKYNDIIKYTHGKLEYQSKGVYKDFTGIRW